ncbi:MAG: fibronectin type III domain-containing protein, partial [Acutalibacteraceae bacterium]
TEVVDIPAIAPTSSQPGYTHQSHCSVCGETLVERELIDHGEYDILIDDTAVTAYKFDAATAENDGMDLVITFTLKNNVCMSSIDKTVIYKVGEVKLSKTKFTYNGKVQKPAVTVKDSTGEPLILNRDYKVIYSADSKYCGEYSVKVVYIGNYAGSKTLGYDIVHNWSEGKTTKSPTCTKTGVKTFTCGCGESYNETIAKLDHSYSKSYTVDKKATCSAEGSKSKHCTRSGCPAKTDVSTIAKLAHTYDNNCDKTCNVCKATRNISHSYKIVTTKATLSKNGKVEYKCSVCSYVSKTTTVYYPKTIKLSATSYTYNGKVKSPTVTVKDSKGNALKKDTDYTVSYASGRKNTGKYSVIVTFNGKYSGNKVLYFNILPSKTSKITTTCGTTSIKASWNKVTGASGYKVELLNSKGKIVKTVTTTKAAYTFEKLSKVTTYKIRVTAYKTIDSKKFYSTVSTTITTSTAPAKATLSKVTAGSKSATPSWKKVSGASGYEVMYSTSSKFSSSKTATVSKGSSTKITIKKLTMGKKYYFKVRAYKKVGSKTVYGSFSSVKSIKVK